MKRAPVLHPFFFTLYPLLYIYTANMGLVSFSQALRPLAVVTLLTGLALLVLWRVVGDIRKAGLLVSLAAVLFFSFGHATEALDSGPRRVGGIFFLVLVGLGWLILFRLRSFTGPTIVLNVVGLFLLGSALIGWDARLAQAERDPMLLPVNVQARPLMQDLPRPANSPMEPPDIYYIILDGYGQARVLADLYGLDNRSFLDYLVSRGFFVAEDSFSNYPQTLLSLASSLNYAYLDDLAALNPNQFSRAPMIQFMQDSRAQRFLRAQGYRVVALETGYEYTDLRSADIFDRPPFWLNQYEQTLLNTTALQPWFGPFQVAYNRARLLHSFRRVPELAAIPGPKFVFVHLVLPHPPFIFDRAGNPTGLDHFIMNDGTHYQLGREHYLNGYREQLLYTNRLAADLIDGILANSATPPVIILQGDHGPGAYLDWESLANTCLRERLAILNAYYLPGGAEKTAALYPGISPVNSLRLVFDAYFGTDLGLLPDRSYYAIWNRPYDLTDVTDRVNSCAPLED